MLDNCGRTCFLLLMLGGRRRKRIVQSKVADSLGISQQSVSRILKELEEEGLITRIVRGRGEFVELTDKAISIIDELSSLSSILLKEEKEVLVLEGIVTEGLGEGRFYMSITFYRKFFEKTLGFKAYPGTLNVRLVGESIWKRKALDAAPGIKVPGFKNKNRVYGGARVFQAKINGYQPAALVFPDRTSHSKDIVEVIAPAYLRAALGLRDGDRVVLEVKLNGSLNSSGRGVDSE